MFAVSLACKIVLGRYAHNETQTDDINSTTQDTTIYILKNFILKSSGD